MALLGALNGLGEGGRLVVACRFLFELCTTEIAEALGCARTVKSRLSRALDRLRQALWAPAQREPSRQELPDA